MAKIRLTKKFDFEMAHALEHYDGLCRNIHGHSYQLEVTIIGEPIDDPESPKRGMLMDFSDLKKIVQQQIITKYDHALVLNAKTDQVVLETLKKYYPKIIIVDYQPTSEHILEDFVALLQIVMPPHVQLHSLKLSETKNSYAQWFAFDNQ